jgi:short subunit fatty acids transporter
MADIIRILVEEAVAVEETIHSRVVVVVVVVVVAAAAAVTIRPEVSSMVDFNHSRSAEEAAVLAATVAQHRRQQWTSYKQCCR